jgi:hypothetical protein
MWGAEVFLVVLVAVATVAGHEDVGTHTHTCIHDKVLADAPPVIHAEQTYALRDTGVDLTARWVSGKKK